MLCDLNRALIEGQLPPCALVAVCGLPIKSRGNIHTCVGRDIVSFSDFEHHLKEALGLGATLTFKNPKKKTLSELGDICLRLGHFWTLHTLSLTVLFHDVPLAVRNAFAFDRRFHLSWVENEQSNPQVTFTATGSLKEWKKIGERASNKDFKQVQREWFGRAYEIIKPTFPAYFA